MENFKVVTFCKEELKNLYLISDKGRVFSLQRNKFMKPQLNNQGYERIELRNKEYKQRFFVHRLVALHFLENKENKPFINHIDCNPLNNKIENLEWVTHKENMEYASNLGRMNKNEEWKSKIILSQHSKEVYSVDKITGVQKVYNSIQSVKLDGFKPSSVCSCCQGKRKTHKGKYWFYNDKEE